MSRDIHWRGLGAKNFPYDNNTIIIAFYTHGVQNNNDHMDMIGMITNAYTAAYGKRQVNSTESIKAPRYLHTLSEKQYRLATVGTIRCR